METGIFKNISDEIITSLDLRDEDVSLRPHEQGELDITPYVKMLVISGHLEDLNTSV